MNKKDKIELSEGRHICKGQTKWCMVEWNGGLICFGLLMIVGLDDKEKSTKNNSF